MGRYLPFSVLEAPVIDVSCNYATTHVHNVHCMASVEHIRKSTSEKIFRSDERSAGHDNVGKGSQSDAIETFFAN